ncbi:MAG: hypothetical protein FJ271_10155 [Planctomycetes bacterium]|nr:hypothetical protein [Planctomycetota bacterium]
MPWAVDSSFQRTTRRILPAALVFALSVSLVVETENLRGLLASVCEADLVPEPREEDGSERALLAHVLPQRARHQRPTRPQSRIASTLRPASAVFFRLVNPASSEVPHPLLRC